MTGPTQVEASDTSIDKMYEIFSKLLERHEQQTRLAPETIKYALEQNPVKLSGPANYASWARQAQLILSSHGYEDLLTEDEEKKRSGDPQAKQTNDRVLVWLLGSMEPIVWQQVEIMPTVHEVWATLEKQFAGKSNKMQATRIMDELTYLKQGTKSVTEYAREVKRLYRDLHYFHSFQLVDKQDISVHHKWFESLIAKLFLDGLDQEFNLRRQLIFSQPEWPSLDDIISSVLEEETRLSQPKEDVMRCGDDRATLMMQTRRPPRPSGKIDKSRSFCDYCKRNGHTKDECFELHGYPPWWEKGEIRSGGANKKQAGHIASLREPPVVDVQALEEFTSNLKLSEGLSSHQSSPKDSSSLIATSNPGAKDRETLGDWDRS